ncbi:MAG: hypothetical protein Q7R98_01280 [Candidatus Jorgensenbacteria bacterium]|nr:hypothetical protein [Candidatus Jorgensenbacteria bacterium]
MEKHIFIFVSVFLAGSLMAGSVAFGQTSSSSVSSPVEKALGDVRDTFDNLINAKDENSAQELPFRIETYKKVIDFTITEAKDLKVKLLAIDSVNEHLVPWQEESLQNLAKAGEYYEAQKKLLNEKEKTLTMDQLKKLAGNFKKEREGNFLPTINQAKDFLIIYQEKSSIDTAKSRWSKIQDDVKKLQKSKIKAADTFASMLKNANGLINEAQTLNKNAERLFWDSYAYTATTTITAASSTDEIKETLVAAETALLPGKTVTLEPASTVIATASSSSTEQTSANTVPVYTATSTATSTDAVLAPTQPPSIRDLVKSSLIKVKDAYQIFIEMSSLVRKGLK